MAHPAAKSMIELARAQDEEVGDGTTSVIITAGEILTAVEGFLEREIHPTVIVGAYFKALEEIVKITERIGVSRILIAPTDSGERVRSGSVILAP